MDNVIYATTRLFYHCTEDQLEMAKNNVKVNLLTSLDTTDKVCEDIGRQVTCYGRRMHPQELIERIDAVDQRALNNCAQRFFYDRDIAIAAIGPIFEMMDYTWYRQRTFWRRY